MSEELVAKQLATLCSAEVNPWGSVSTKNREETVVTDWLITKHTDGSQEGTRKLVQL